MLSDAILPAPDTFANVTEFATCANGTSPDTLEPSTAFAVPANVAKFIVPEIFAAMTLDMPPPSPVIKPVVVIVFDPNAFNRVTTFESPYDPPPPPAAINVPSPARTLATLPSKFRGEILPNVGVPVTFA